MRTTGKQCGLAATGVYQPSLRSPWLAAVEGKMRLLGDKTPQIVITPKGAEECPELLET